VRLNAVAPGITRTPLSERVLADAEMGPAIRAFGEQVPLGAAASPAQVAAVMAFMLSPAANFVCGSLFYVDGGSDAMLRPDAV
jgi:NAD(P)-dependent dehydrogenase (short-subunit alcohol dehydrogenase family)